MTGPARPVNTKTLFSLAAVLAAVATIVVIIVSHRAAPAAAPTEKTTFTGRTWFVITVQTGTTTSEVTPGTPAARARVTFERHGSFLANDGINSLSGHYRRTPTGYRTLRDTISTAIGYLGADATLLAVQRAIAGALSGTSTVAADVHDGRLTLRFAATTITLRAQPRVTDNAAPSGHPSSKPVVPASGIPSK